MTKVISIIKRTAKFVGFIAVTVASTVSIVCMADFIGTKTQPIKYMNISCDTKYGKMEFTSVNPPQKNSTCTEVKVSQ